MASRRRLDLQQRLLHCSPVSRCWQAAAVTATVDVSVRLQDRDKWRSGAETPPKKLYGRSKAQRVDAWLARHGQHVTGLPPAGLQFLSVLSGLQLLRMPNASQHLPWLTQLRQLTSVELRPAVFTMQHLDISVSRFRYVEDGLVPQFLASMQQLRLLKLGGLHRAALPVLLAAMPGLTRLEELELTGFEYQEQQPLPEEEQPLPEEERPCYSALLPSSPALRKVAVHGLADAYMLPAGCAAQLLAPGRAFTCMRELTLANCQDGGQLYEQLIEGMPHLFGPGDIGRLAACCPNLEVLCIPGAVQSGLDMRPLLQLTGLTQLALAGAAVTDDLAAAVLRRLKRLQILDVAFAEGLTDVGLLALTSLRQLTSLQISDCGIMAQELHYFHADVDLTAAQSRTSQRHPLDVWQQLLHLCITSETCCPRIVAALEAAEVAGHLQ
ncbi:hypothetical protein COO60DRAFT_1460004 [Scenedesmus sp. NREL 46B-D3]|nr:hypothetical protein COO60DRAFT_1460004 [Scenedesmus sp. NREL 46B-D3]